MVCPKCISHNPEGSETCHWCGNALRQGQEAALAETVVACVACGQELDQSVSFCSTCGYAVGLAADESTTICPTCISHNPEGAESCHWCGNALRRKQEVVPDEIVSACIACGGQENPTDNFCNQCGLQFLEILEPELEQPVGMPSRGTPELDYPPDLPHEQMESGWERKGFLIRLAAWGIDQIPIYIAYVLWGFVSPGLEESYFQAYSIGMVVIYTVYYVSFTAIWGKTPGKMVLGLRVVDSRGNTPAFYQVLLRETVGKWLSAIPLFLGFLSISWDEKRQGWYDRMAKTYVIGKQKDHTDSQNSLPNSRESQLSDTEQLMTVVEIMMPAIIIFVKAYIDTRKPGDKLDIKQIASKYGIPSAAVPFLTKMLTDYFRQRGIKPPW